MQRRRPRGNWKIRTESVYVYGHEERLKEAYEKVLPEKTILINYKENGDEEFSENRSVRASIEHSASPGAND